MDFTKVREFAIEQCGAEPGIEGYDSKGVYGFGWNSDYGKELRAKLDAIDKQREYSKPHRCTGGCLESGVKGGSAKGSGHA